MKSRLATKIFMGYLLIAAVTVCVYSAMEWLTRSGYIEPLMSIILFFCLIIFFTALYGLFYSKSMTADMRELIESARRISYGDLTEGVEIRRKKRYPDEIDDLIGSINTMLESLRELAARTQNTAINISQSAQNLSATAQEMNASTEEVSGTIEEISRGAELQASLVENTSKTVREIAGSIELTSSNAMVTSTSVSEAATKAQQSGDLSNVAMEKMKGVFEKMANAQEMVVRFGEKTQRIGKIVEMITNIARQTNLLALNATIEAARAGEYGKGFAVVADEVRKLAEGTSASAEQITDLVAEIEQESNRVVTGMRETANDIHEGQEDLGTIGASLEEIVQMVTTAADKVKNISDLSQIQAEGAKELVRSIDEIAKVAHDNASSTEEVSAATQQQTASMQEMAQSAQALSGLSDEMKRLISKFRLDTERVVTDDSDVVDFLPSSPVKESKEEKTKKKAASAGKESGGKSDKVDDDMDFVFE